MFAMFIERAIELAIGGAFVGMITMQSWMFLRSFRQLREAVVTGKSIKSMVHMPYLGKGIRAWASTSVRRQLSF